MNNTFQKTSPSTGNSLPTIALHNAVIDVKINIINEYVPIKNKVVLKLINIQNKIAITITIPNIIGNPITVEPVVFIIAGKVITARVT